MFDVLHLGMAKCGSTYLQELGFPSHPQLEVYGHDCERLLSRDFLSYSIGYDPESLRQQLVDRVTGTGDAVRIFSNEALAGSMHGHENMRLYAELMREMFPDAKVLLIIRNQYSYMYSSWNQMVQEGATTSLRDYLCPRWPWAPSGGLVTKLMYHEYIQFLFELFGREQVKVLLLEELKDDFAGFFRQLYGFCGVDDTFLPERAVSRKSYGYLAANAFRVTNYLTRTKHNHTAPLPYALYEWKRSLFNRLRDVPGQSRKDVKPLLAPSVRLLFQQSNRKTADLIGKDLERYGYDL